MPPKDNDNPESSADTKEKTASDSKKEEEAEAPRVIKPEYEGLLHENGDSDGVSSKFTNHLTFSFLGLQQPNSRDFAR
jgi:hypothetical protein